MHRREAVPARHAQEIRIIEVITQIEQPMEPTSLADSRPVSSTSKNAQLINNCECDRGFTEPILRGQPFPRPGASS